MKNIIIFFGICFAVAYAVITDPSLAGTGTRYGTWSSSGKAIALTLGSANQISGVNAAGTGIENKAVTVTSAGITDVSGNFSVATNKFTVASATGATVIDGGASIALTVGTNTAAQDRKIEITAPAGQFRVLQFTTTGSRRWSIYANATAEGGADAGSNFRLSAFTDAGAAIDDPIAISRVAGGTMTLSRTIAISTTTDATTTAVASVITQGGLATVKGVVVGTNLRMGSEILISKTAPTISSGFGTSPSIASNNGTAAFTINVGTGGTASTGVIGLPTATTGWICTCTDITTFSVTVFLCRQTATATTTATIGQFSNAAVAKAWAASDIVRVSCFAY